VILGPTGNSGGCRGNSNQVGCVTKLQRSLDAAAWRCCSPCSCQDFYHRACVGRVTLETHAGYDWMVHRHLPSPDFHRLDWQPYGLRAKKRKRRENIGLPTDTVGYGFTLTAPVSFPSGDDCVGAGLSGEPFSRPGMVLVRGRMRPQLSARYVSPSSNKASSQAARSKRLSDQAARPTSHSLVTQFASMRTRTP
jgi:hypothetical protein